MLPILRKSSRPHRPPHWLRRVALIGALLATSWAPSGAGAAAPTTFEQCDPTKIVSADACVRCHGREAAVWQKSAHHRSFDTLHRNPQAKAIAQRLGVTSVKRSGECVRCHYTAMTTGGETRLVAGVSCESCHGAAKDWIDIHGNYGGLTGARSQDTDERQRLRREESIRLGMRNPQNIYLIARSCLGCHTAPDERLVNVGGHSAGSAGFELVAWSQGSIKHDFLSNDRDAPALAKPRLRVMYVAGQVADLEFSTRAIALATSRQNYGLVAARRAAQVASRLEEIQSHVRQPLLDEVLNAFAEADLKTNNTGQLLAIADRIQKLGVRIGDELDGAALSAVDAWLPSPSQYK